jgi:DNA-binding MurR/RpiR family transcriptional regulator
MHLENLKPVVDAAYGSPLPQYGHLLPADSKVMIAFDSDIRMVAEVVLVAEYEGKPVLIFTDKENSPYIRELYDAKPIFTYYTPEEKRKLLGP